jgi:diguanylate cyclase (GGDEF)-like protein
VRRASLDRRALMIDPDLGAASVAVEALRSGGMEATAVAEAEAGLRILAATEPQVLVLELELRGKDGRWLLRRLRDDYMGVRPRVVLHTRPEAMAGGVAELGADVVVLKPAHPEAMLLAALGELGAAPGPASSEKLRELLTLTLLHGDVEGALSTMAKRLAQVFRAEDCVLAVRIGDRDLRVTARGQELDGGLEENCRAALDAGVPVLASKRDGVVTLFAVQIAPPGGTPLGHIILIGDRPHIYSTEVADHLRALAQRLHGELAWRSVHERIAADRDRLRESSMVDPMLPGVWTRAALDQTLPGEVSACQRRKEPMSVAMVDLRGLRHVNERYGHVVGDEALRHLAMVVRGAVRTQDLVARYSGDALAIVLPGTPAQDARIVVDRIQDALIEAPLLHNDAKIPLSVASGIAAMLGEDDTGDAALARAAAAMKAAKRRREAVVVADPALPDDALGSQSLATTGGLEAGTTLGGMYQILHEISRGAMGVVYRAEDLGLGRPVAVKTLRPDLARDRNFVERFRAEASTLAALRHENLVQVYAFGTDGADVYFVMELVEGEPLEDRIELARHEARMMPLGEVSRVIGQIGEALDAMHRAGVLHRDVKPANVLIDRARGRAVLVDVGIAKKRGTPTDPAGTPGFTAPESFTGATEGPQADVYGLAATAYTLLTTHVPFRGESVEDILRRQKGSEAPPASSLRPGLPPSVDAALARSLHPEASRRHVSASEFSRALALALGECMPDVQDGTDALLEVDPQIVSSFLDLHSSGGGEGDTAVRQRPETPLPVEVEVTAPSPAPANPVGATTPAMVLFPSLREPDAPGTGVPHTRGVLFRSSYRVLGARHGAAWVAMVSRNYPALAQALQPQSTLLSWHPTELYVTMLKAIAQSGRDAATFARELGRVATSATFSRFFGADPTLLSPWHVIEAADLFWRRYHTWGAVAVRRRDKDGAEVAIAAGPREPLVCASSGGILEEVVHLAGATRVEVAHPRCESLGAEACVFSIRWQMPG